MKNLFRGYYPPSEKEFDELWKHCIFIFDTNVLLDFYEHRKETREDFFRVLDTIKDRLWIPHQVALEYHKNMDNKKIEAKLKLDNAKKILDEITNYSEKELLKYFNFQSFPPETVKKMIEDVKKVFDTFGDKLASDKEEIITTNETDWISNKIADLFHEKVGKIPTQEELDKIYLDGEKRYEMCRPPGFLDKKKDKDKDKDKDSDKDKDKSFYFHKGLVFKKLYGDLILWKQILEKVKAESLKHIIFITRDNKEDWWKKEHGQTIGPRPELNEEIIEAGASIFYMYTPQRFLEYAEKHLGVQVKEESIQEVEEISLLNILDEPELQDNSFIQLGITEDDLNSIKPVGTTARIGAIARGRAIAGGRPIAGGGPIARGGPIANNPSSMHLGPYIKTSLNNSNPISDLIKQLEIIEKSQQ